MGRIAATLLLLVLCCSSALAHSAARGFVLLLPTGYVIFGGALAVLASSAIASLLGFRPSRSEVGERLPSARRSLFPSLVSAVLLGLLIWTGFSGPRDPAENLLPLAIWTLWWVVLVLLHPLFGNLWAALNPFSGVHLLLNRALGGRLEPPPLRLPVSLAYWPAVLTFAAFAWFQLVDAGPQDPSRLALVVAFYAAATVLAAVAFGPKAWLGLGDPFAVFLAQLGATAPFTRAGVRLPGAGLLSLAPLPLAGILFVLLTLSSISFDGFANSFVWFAAIGVNPLDYPGRTALMAANTLGLAGSFLALTSLFMAAVTFGWWWAGRPRQLLPLLGRFVFSLIPVSIAYHFAHYLGDTLLNLQYLALALNDPTGSDANLLGLAHAHVTASFQNTASGALVLYTTQTAAVIIGHLVAVLVAHTMAIETGCSRAVVLKLETPLACFVVFYTAFGLWLLATPAIT